MNSEDHGSGLLGAKLRCAGSAENDAAQAVLVGVRAQDGGLSDADLGLLSDYGVQASRRMARNGFHGTPGEALPLDLERDAPAWVLLVGLGEPDPAQARRAGAAAGAWLRARDPQVRRAVDRVAASLPEACVQAWFEGLLLGYHRYQPSRSLLHKHAPLARPGAPDADDDLPHRTTSADLVGLLDLEPPNWAPDERLVQHPPSAAPPARDGLDPLLVEVADPADRLSATAALATAMAAASARARSWVGTPGNIKSPAWLVAQAQDVAERTGLQITIWDGPALAEQRCGGLLAVGAGSARGPALVRLDHRPAGAHRLVVLVGKGITFDSGGLSLKPADSMVMMKTDMSGAAAVLAVMSAVAQVAAPVAVTGLLCLAENLPGAAATRPGDVVTHRNAATSEVRNTDAEGRLVLADGLALAAEMGADVVVDIATLTGAATLGLGRGHAALYATSDTLAAGLARAGDCSGEAVWRMPLLADYRDRISSPVADQANADVPGGPGPGSITAALFLQSFAGSQPWAHLDIAGPARSETERDDAPKGGTGFGARLLLEWLRAGAPA